MHFQSGEILELVIEKLVPGGEGLAHHNGFAVFVPDTWPGDRLQARVISCKKKYARALPSHFLSPSPQRQIAPCPVAQDCGGCQWQGFNYPAQLEAKRQLLLESLHQQGLGTWAELEALVPPVLGMDEPFYYRNKGQFPLQDIAGEIQTGFFKPRSHELVAIEHCLIHHPRINEILLWTRDWLRQHKLPCYHENTDRGILRHLMIRHGFHSDESLVGLVCRESLPALQTYAQELMSHFDSVVGVLENLQPERSNRILGSETHVLAGQDYYLESLDGLHFQVALPAFFQVNPIQTEVLYRTVENFLALTGSENLVDAYSGAGSISLWLARRCQQVLGLEVVAAATENARQNARLNGCDNARFLCGRVEDLLPQELERQSLDALVLDPPRKGCEPQVLDSIVQTPLTRLVYVSCNPSTLARDLARLKKGGFQLTRCQPVDLFPHTHHLETVVLVERPC